LSPHADACNGESGSEHPPCRAHFHVEVEVGEQKPPRVDAAREQVEHCFADRRHHRRAGGKEHEVKGSHLAVAPVKRAVRQQPNQETRHQHRLVGFELGLNEEMHGPEHGDRINEAVKRVPTPGAQSADRCVRGG